MTVDDWAGRVVVRYREAGHLRLQMPAELSNAAAVKRLEQGLRECAGVYRVAFDHASRRLSIRFDSHLASTGDVARHLKALLETMLSDLPASPAADQKSSARSRLREAGDRIRGALLQSGTRLKGISSVFRKPRTPQGLLRRKLQPLIAAALTEEGINSFLLDLLVLYLVKVHWDLISQRWIRFPLRFSGAWLSTFYLTYLLVRHRKQTAKK